LKNSCATWCSNNRSRFLEHVDESKLGCELGIVAGNAAAPIHYDYDVIVVGARCAGAPTAMLVARGDSGLGLGDSGEALGELIAPA
jgi:hypothetical protein